jgi:hypothetical protein
MKKTIILSLFVLSGNLTFSQTFGGTDQTIAPIYYNLSTFESNKKFINAYFRDIEGTPYIFKDFVQSEIVGIKSKMMMRYNAYDDVVEIQKAPNEIYTVSKNPLYNTFLMNLNQFKLRLVNFESDNNEPIYSYLFELTSKNELSLLRRDKINFVEGRIPRNSFDLGNKPKFTPIVYSYYLEGKDKKIREFPNSKAKLVELYPKKADEIKKYMKENMISLSKENDLIKLTQHLSTL